MLAILDYKAGNQTSVQRALEFLKIPCRIAATAEETRGARGLIFPGVGAARQVFQNGQWVDAPVRAATVQKLEEIILTKARDLRQSAIRE